MGAMVGITGGALRRTAPGAVLTDVLGSSGAGCSVRRQLAIDSGLAVLCVLHQPALALRYSHRVVGLRDGVVAFDLPADRDADLHIALLYKELAA